MCETPMRYERVTTVMAGNGDINRLLSAGWVIINSQFCADDRNANGRTEREYILHAFMGLPANAVVKTLDNEDLSAIQERFKALSTDNTVGTTSEDSKDVPVNSAIVAGSTETVTEVKQDTSMPNEQALLGQRRGRPRQSESFHAPVDLNRSSEVVVGLRG